jgi:hypothetical protein
MTPEPDQLLDLARRYTAAWCSPDPASVAAHYSPEGSLTINGGAPAVGRAAVTESARGFMVAFPDMQVLMDDLLMEDGGVVYHWTLIGTNTGPGGMSRSAASTMRIDCSISSIRTRKRSMLSPRVPTGTSKDRRS